MDLFLLFILILCLIGSHWYIKSFNQKQYLSISTTNCIKGIFILFVFLAHALQYIEVGNGYDHITLFLMRNLKQLIVVMFLFYSGYGVYESFKKKKDLYVEQMPKNRILKTLFHFDIAILVFILVNLFLDREMHGKQILFSFIGWDSVGNSNWYIFSTLGLYCITYLSLKAFKGKQAVGAIWIQTILFVLFLSLYKNGYWYNTLWCYPLGITYSYYKDKIENFVLRNNFSYFVCLFTALFSTFIFTYLGTKNVYYYELWAISFTLFIVFITMKINIQNPILNWLGKNLFWLYILQRIPMLILQYYRITNYPYLFFIVSFIATILLAYEFSFIFQKIDKKLFKKTKSRA